MRYLMTHWRIRAAAYKRLKDEFNDTVPDKENAVRRAALFVFLNKHGYNGLWRVNSKGRFNVPFGRYAKRSIPSASSIHLLQRHAPAGNHPECRF